MVEYALKKLRQRYSDHIIEIIRLMLKFEEQERLDALAEEEYKEQEKV